LITEATIASFYFWYAVVFGLLTLGSLIGKAYLKTQGKYDVVPPSVQHEEVMTIPFLLIGIVGVAAYGSGVSLGPQLFWQVYVVLLFLHFVFSFWLPKLRLLRAKTSTREFLIFNIVGVALSLPLYIGLYSYAYLDYPLADTTASYSASVLSLACIPSLSPA